MNKSASRLRVFFLHNPKAGGTSITTLLTAAIGAENAASSDASLPIDRKQWKHWSKHDFIYGHCGYELFKSAGRNYFLITNFRHPVSRIVSLYDFWRNNIGPDDVIDEYLKMESPPDTAVAPYLARTLSFSDFIRRRDVAVSVYIRNWHARQLLRTPWEYWRPNWLDRWRLRRRIEALHWFYICEEPAPSTAWFAQQFPSLEGRSLTTENPTEYSGSSRTVPSKDDIEVILRDNRLDVEAYNLAQTILHARLAQLA